MSTKNQINGLWINGELSSMEKLCIYSFLKHDYHFTLWTYDDFSHYSYIEGLEVKDAREIIPENQVFFYTNENQFGHGKGSYAGFSDIFRYRLLYLYGGWWVDMDVTCLKRFELDAPYVFRQNKHDKGFAVGNIMYVSKNSTLMAKCYEEAKDKITESNTDWTLPIKILNQHIQSENLHQYIHVFSNKDSWLEVSSLLTNTHIPSTWSAIHWMNEEFRRINISKEDYLPNSVLGVLYHKFQLGSPIVSPSRICMYYVKTSRIYYGLIQFRRDSIISSFKTFFKVVYLFLKNLFIKE